MSRHWAAFAIHEDHREVQAEAFLFLTHQVQRYHTWVNLQSVGEHAKRGVRPRLVVPQPGSSPAAADDREDAVQLNGAVQVKEEAYAPPATVDSEAETTIARLMTEKASILEELAAAKRAMALEPDRARAVGLSDNLANPLPKEPSHSSTHGDENGGGGGGMGIALREIKRTHETTERVFVRLQALESSVAESSLAMRSKSQDHLQSISDRLRGIESAVKHGARVDGAEDMQGRHRHPSSSHASDQRELEPLRTSLSSLATQVDKLCSRDQQLLRKEDLDALEAKLERLGPLQSQAAVEKRTRLPAIQTGSTVEPNGRVFSSGPVGPGSSAQDIIDGEIPGTPDGLMRLAQTLQRKLPQLFALVNELSQKRAALRAALVAEGEVAGGNQAEEEKRQREDLLPGRDYTPTGLLARTDQVLHRERSHVLEAAPLLRALPTNVARCAASLGHDLPQALKDSAGVSAKREQANHSAGSSSHDPLDDDLCSDCNDAIKWLVSLASHLYKVSLQDTTANWERVCRTIGGQLYSVADSLCCEDHCSELSETVRNIDQDMASMTFALLRKVAQNQRHSIRKEDLRAVWQQSRGDDEVARARRRSGSPDSPPKGFQLVHSRGDYMLLKSTSGIPGAFDTGGHRMSPEDHEDAPHMSPPASRRQFSRGRLGSAGDSSDDEEDGLLPQGTSPTALLTKKGGSPSPKTRPQGIAYLKSELEVLNEKRAKLEKDIKLYHRRVYAPSDMPGRLPEL